MTCGFGGAGFLATTGFGMTGLVAWAFAGFGLGRWAGLRGGGAISKSVCIPRSNFTSPDFDFSVGKMGEMVGGDEGASG